VTADSKPTIPYWHLWTGADGVSHQTRCTMTEVDKAAIAPEAAPQWIGAKTKDAASTTAAKTPGKRDIDGISLNMARPHPDWTLTPTPSDFIL